jgi:hypothetical protein
MASPGEPLAGAIPPAPAQPERKGKITCEFCECQLTSAGEVLKFSDKAKAHRTSDEKITELEGTIETLRHELETLRAAHPPQTEPPANKRKGFSL